MLDFSQWGSCSYVSDIIYQNLEVTFKEGIPIIF